MKYLLLAFIRLYWLAWPRHLNRPCLYRESCSHCVYRTTRDAGFLDGCRALRHRFRTCRPGYTPTTRDQTLGLLLADGSFLPGELVAETILQPLLADLQQLEQQLAAASRP